MISNTKCLWTFILTTFISILTEQLIQCSPTFTQPADGAESESLTDTYSQNDALKRDWSKFASWGKRGFNGKFTVWGKRDGVDIDDDGEVAQTQTPDKKNWSKFASWGKRDALMNSDKRAWAKSFQSWGKRSADDIQGSVGMDDSTSDDVKRRWNQLALWGKRDFTGDEGLMDKRKWAQFATWGKRGNEFEDEYEKRKWSPLPTWGKRDSESEDGLEKRNWVKFASWGKRWRAKPWTLEPWGKRRWTGITTWGKRSADPENYLSKDVAQKLLNLFDFNGEHLLVFDL